MIFLNYFLLALNSIRQRKLRSWLTMIGIFIGVAAVVSLISIGQGLQGAIESQFEALGKDKIVIEPKLMGMPGSAVSGSLTLTSKDLKVIENVRGVKWAAGYLIKQGQAKFKGETGIGFATGLNPEEMELLTEIGDFGIYEGRRLEKGDVYKVVVGYDHAYGDIWERGIEIREKIEIEGVDFRVVGIMTKVGNPIDDGILYVPKDALKEITGVEDEESSILVKTADGFDPIDVADDIERKLRKSRGEKEDQETFRVQTSEQLLESFSNIFGIVQAVLVGIAAISLLVGGVGIMNTMYTSILERTKDIGVMKAVGAKNSDILSLFLIESGLLGMFGGLIGVCIGLGLAKTVELIAAQQLGVDLLKASFSLELIVGALMFSFLVGAISGVLPARQASRMKPVDALRYE